MIKKKYTLNDGSRFSIGLSNTEVQQDPIKKIYGIPKIEQLFFGDDGNRKDAIDEMKQTWKEYIDRLNGLEEE